MLKFLLLIPFYQIKARMASVEKEEKIRNERVGFKSY